MANTKFEKLDLQTKDLTTMNIEKIGALFPNVITEYETDQGDIKKGINFDLLQQLLSKELVDTTKEKYQLNWPGKKAALLKANTPITETLRPDIANSKNWDNTENVFIEGDNFTALKILQESYLGKIKMIYIDPPYNTGKDFVYSDKFTIDKSEYAEQIRQYDEENNKLFKENTRTNPRYHSDWLSMMYERLHIAIDLLREDGVIFISIDDNEVHNLRKICDEIFGEENFVREIIWLKNNAQNDAESIEKNHEYVLVYQKLEAQINKNSQEIKEVFEDVLGNYYYIGAGITTGGAGGTLNARPNLGYTIYYNEEIGEKLAVEDYDKEKVKISNNENEVYSDREDLLAKGFKIIRPPKKGAGLGCWTWALDKFNAEKDKILIRRSKEGYSVFKKEFVNKELIYVENNKFYYQISKEKPLKSFIPNISSSLGTKDLNLLFNMKIFDNSKPVNLIKYLIESSTNSNDIILDFFAGSSATAHAVMAQNAEDGGNCKFIMVQLDEETDEKSEAYKAGYKTIAELSRERIRRAGEKIIKDNADKLAERESPLDIGFRAFRVDSTNMKDVYYHPKDLKQDNLLDLVDTIKADRTTEDLLIQVLLDKALTLDLPIRTQKFKQNTVYIVGDNDLIVCVDQVLDADIIDDLAKLGADTAVFRDSSFATEADRIKLETHFKRLSPRDTRILVI